MWQVEPPSQVAWTPFGGLMRHKSGSKTCLSPPETSCDRAGLFLNISVVVRIKRMFTIYYSVILKNEVIVWEGEFSPSNADRGMASPSRRCPRTAHVAMHTAAERMAAWHFPQSAGPLPGRSGRTFCGAGSAHKMRPAPTEKAHATRRRQCLPSCCTCAPAMLAKPRF